MNLSGYNDEELGIIARFLLEALDDVNLEKSNRDFINSEDSNSSNSIQSSYTENINNCLKDDELLVGVDKGNKKDDDFDYDKYLSEEDIDLIIGEGLSNSSLVEQVSKGAFYMDSSYLDDISSVSEVNVKDMFASHSRDRRDNSLLTMSNKLLGTLRSFISPIIFYLESNDISYNGFELSQYMGSISFYNWDTMYGCSYDGKYGKNDVFIAYYADYGYGVRLLSTVDDGEPVQSCPEVSKYKGFEDLGDTLFTVNKKLHPMHERCRTNKCCIRVYKNSGEDISYGVYWVDEDILYFELYSVEFCKRVDIEVRRDNAKAIIVHK